MVKNLGLRIIKHDFNGESQLVHLSYKKLKFKFKINLIGKVQLKNILMAAIAAEKSGINISKVINSLYYLKPIDGRLEKVGQIKNNSKVILDYAHTPDALKIVLQNLRQQFPNKKILIVFGWEIEIRKRSLMGKIANSYCDEIYLTDDNKK